MWLAKRESGLFSSTILYHPQSHGHHIPHTRLHSLLHSPVSFFYEDLFKMTTPTRRVVLQEDAGSSSRAYLNSGRCGEIQLKIAGWTGDQSSSKFRCNLISALQGQCWLKWGSANTKGIVLQCHQHCGIYKLFTFYASHTLAYEMSRTVFFS